MRLDRVRMLLILYGLFDLYIGGHNGGLLPLTNLAAAQFTTVTGTVVDPNGIPYALGTIAPVIVIPSGAGTPVFSTTGTVYTPPVQASGLDGAGHFIVTLADNTALTPAGTKWNFTVCSAAGTIQPALGKGPVCFSLAAPITISGASQDISSNLNAVALALTLGVGCAQGTCVVNNPSSDQTITSSASQGLIFNSTNGSIHIWPHDPTFGVPLIRLNSKTSGDSALTFALNGTEDFSLYHHAGGTTLAIAENDLGVDVWQMTAGVNSIRGPLQIGQPSGAISGQIQLFGGTSGTCNRTVTATSTLVSDNCPVQVTAVAFSSLPACAAGTEGTMRAVNDSTTNVWGATITGSGANHVLAYCDGTNWTVAAK
jgi:hypothetical protein